MRFSILIVDDEPLAREGLRALAMRDPEVAQIHEAGHGLQAIEMIRETRPALVLLDIQMPECDGFEVVRQVGAAAMPPVVFVTAHDEFAIRAFEIHALDYLLKPVTAERFQKAMQRAKTALQAPAPEVTQQMLGLLESLVAPQHHVRRLAVRSVGRTVFVDVDDIDWIGAAENYVELHVGRDTHLLHVPLTTIERSLEPGRFLRIHRSVIVQVARIQSLQPELHGEFIVTLRDGQQLKSGRTYSERLRALTLNPF